MSSLTVGDLQVCMEKDWEPVGRHFPCGLYESLWMSVIGGAEPDANIVPTPGTLPGGAKASCTCSDVSHSDRS